MSVPFVVIVAPERPCREVLAVLRDWSSVDLVQPFLWVEPQPLDADARKVQGVLVIDGRARYVDALSHLADAGQPDVIRVCVLDPLTGPSPRQAGVRLTEKLRAAMPSAPVTQVHVVAAVLGLEPERAFDAATGWHNIILAPEQAKSPASARELITVDTDPLTRAMHHAAGLAGLLGLWRGGVQCALDSVPPPPEARVRLTRSYLRWVQADAVQAQLRNGLTDVGDRIPRPKSGGRLLPYLENARPAVEAAADNLYAVHSWILARPREQIPRDRKHRTGFAESLRMLWGFLWAALRNAPRDWVRKIVDGASRSAARVGQRVVFGDDSAFEVVVRGRKPDGRLASWSDFDKSLATLRASLADVSRHREPTHDSGAFWKDFVGVGLSLADGLQRVPAVPQPMVGGSPAIVRHGSDVAPSPDRAFLDLPQHVSAQLGIQMISPADLLDAARAEADINEQAREASLAYDMADARARLAAWRQKTQFETYMGRVGGRLTDRLTELQEEIRECIQRVKSAGSPQVDTRLADRQAQLSRRMRWTSIAAVLVIVGVLVAGWQEWLPWGRAISWLVGAAVTWFLMVVLLFLLGQRELFQLLHRMKNEEARLRVEMSNLAAAVDDLDRVSHAYRQFVPWATSWASFWTSPLAHLSSPATLFCCCPANSHDRCASALSSRTST